MQNPPIVKFTVLDQRKNAVTLRENGSGFTLHSPVSFTLKPGQYSDIDFQISVEIPPGHVGLINTVGGLARYKAVNANDSVIQPYYTKALHLSVVNNGHDAVEIRKGDAVCIMIVMPVLLDHEIS